VDPALILDKTQTIRLAPDLSHLSAGERTAVAKLIEVGRIFQDVYEDQRHHQALAGRGAAARRLAPRDALPPVPGADRHHARQPPRAVPARGRAAAGQERLPAGTSPRRNIDAFSPPTRRARAELTHLRSVVRRADRASLTRDLAKLRAIRCSTRSTRA
jgi:hypothetical protein